MTIGDHCVIGAGSVVTREVPNYSIMTGVPGRCVGTVHVDENREIRLEYDR